MLKLFQIAFKDLKLSFRDPSALVMMLLTPFAITLAIGFAFGGFNRSSGSTGLRDIPVLLVNDDAGQFGEQLVSLFESEELAELLEPARVEQAGQARLQVDADLAAAAVIIPENFSESILPAELLRGVVSIDSLVEREQSVIEIYTNPARPVSTGVVRSLVDGYLNQVAGAVAGGQVTIIQLLRNGLLDPQEAQLHGEQLGYESGRQAVENKLISIRGETRGEASAGFDWLSYSAPSMAIIFLMFTVTAGGRSILAERQAGTLPRLLVTPSRPWQVIGGKICGIFLTGLAQMSILIVASATLFRIRWGDLVALALLTIALVLAASTWGMLLAAYARTPGQASNLGTALTLVFAAGAGNFVPRQGLPGWLQTLSYISPNAWGLEGYGKLTAGGGLIDVYPFIVGLMIMAGLLFMIASLAFRKQYR